MEHDVYDTPPVCDYCGRRADYVRGQIGDGASDRIEHLCASCAQEAPPA